MRLLQISGPAGLRRVGIVQEPGILLLDGITSVYQLALEAMAAGDTLGATAERHASSDSLEYDAVYTGHSPWRILPAMDHPHDPAHCLISGTGLTHMASARNRQAMHAAGERSHRQHAHVPVGRGGRAAGAGRDWRASRMVPQRLRRGAAGARRSARNSAARRRRRRRAGDRGHLLVDASGRPRRIGMAAGNEFSDHRFEKKNYLNLAASKLMPCAIGPELITDPDFSSVAGEVAIERGGKVVWSKAISSGDASMSHSLANLEHHHFKHAGHRIPGDVHVHFFGADAFSFGEGLRLEDGDMMQVRFAGFGRPLRNPLRIDRSPRKLFAAVPL